MTEVRERIQKIFKEQNITMDIYFVGFTINEDWGDTKRRPLYEITLSSPKKTMRFHFWDSIYRAEIMQMTNDDYAKECYKCAYADLPSQDKIKIHKELADKKAACALTEREVLDCLSFSDPGNFFDFCEGYGYDKDSREAEKIYHAVLKEYLGLRNIFTAEQLDELLALQEGE